MTTLSVPRPAGSTRAGRAASSPDQAAARLVDTVHDLLARLVGDHRRPVAATADVLLRAIARHGDRVLHALDATTVLTAAHTYAIAVARTEEGEDAAEAVTDHAVLDLLVRRGLDARAVAAITGVRRRELTVRREVASARLAIATGEDSPAAAVRAYADAPLDHAPPALRERLAPALATATARPRRRDLSVIVMTVIVTAAALTALAVNMSRLIEVADPSPVAVEAVTADDVVLSPDAEEPTAPDASTSADTSTSTETGELLLPRDSDRVVELDDLDPDGG